VTPSGIRVLGIDTALRSTGWAVVEGRGSRLAALGWGTIRNAPNLRLSACLARIWSALSDVVEEHKPSLAAVEGAFFSRNARTAMTLGEARGTAIALCAARELQVYEYAPRRVKQAIVGFGGAEKQQVRRMVMTLLALDREPQEDAGDALAIAICHIHNGSGHASLAPEPI
jgi:crossover junction endodeoxyribonuclease RuvC